MIIQSTREATRGELIQRIKDLEKENKYLRDENAIYRNETISKYVIREKIEELEKDFEDIRENEFINCSSVDEFKTWLAENNTEVIYECKFHKN